MADNNLLGLKLIGETNQCSVMATGFLTPLVVSSLELLCIFY